MAGVSLMALRAGRRWLWVVLAVFAGASHAGAQTLGVRAGASAGPDQFYFGGHLETREIARRVHFRPNVEVGVGSDITMVTANFEVVYRGPVGGSRDWKFDAGGGPALVVRDRDDSTDTTGGLNLLGAFEHRRGLFFEIKVGLIDAPEFKAGIGYSFR